MRQLEALLGEAAFRDGVRSYLRRHAFGNATWDDLIAALAGRTKLDLKQWSHMWIDEPGRPVIRTELEVKDGRVQRLALQQRDPQGRNRVWPQQLRVTVGCGRTDATHRGRPGGPRSRPDALARRLRARLCAGGRRRLGLRRIRTRRPVPGVPGNRHVPASATRWPGASPGPHCGTPCSAGA